MKKLWDQLTSLQKLSIAIGLFTFLGGSVAQLDVVVGVGISKIIVALCTLAAGSISVVMTVVSGQTSQLANVQAMPGVSGVTINGQASPAVAAMAVDDANSKIGPAPGSERRVAEIASTV